MHHELINEYYGSEKQSTYHVQAGSNRISSPVVDQRIANKHRARSLRNFFRDVFLPQGYPESVTEDYLEYQCWDTLQAFCSSLTGTLATEAVLKSVGVGDQSATALAATLTWLLKDGAGMIGRIAFAWSKGSRLDCDSKRWRLAADVLNDLAIFVDILTPYFKPLFIYMVCFSSVCRSIVGVAGGATRAALTQHQARRNNLADVSAKDGSQETLVNLSALITSFLLIPLVSGKTTLIWTLFTVMTVCHIVANYRAIRSLRMDTLNESRFRILIGNFFANRSVSLREINRCEPVLDIGGFLLWNQSFRIRAGCRLAEIQIFDRSAAGGGDRGGKYQIGVTATKSLADRLAARWWRLVTGGQTTTATNRGHRQQRAIVRIALKTDADSIDVMRAFFHAELIRMELDKENHVKIYEKNLIDSTRETLKRTFPSFLENLREHGWVTTHNLLYCDEFRYSIEKSY